jgi:hypothetical protein
MQLSWAHFSDLFMALLLFDWASVRMPGNELLPGNPEFFHLDGG